jgi:hypothetical protein
VLKLGNQGSTAVVAPVKTMAKAGSMNPTPTAAIAARARMPVVTTSRSSVTGFGR